MSADEPPIENLKRRQLAQELAEREQLAQADSQADADRHRRRAEKASYLRHKLEQQQRADRDAAGEDR